MFLQDTTMHCASSTATGSMRPYIEIVKLKAHCPRENGALVQVYCPGTKEKKRRRLGRRNSRDSSPVFAFECTGALTVKDLLRMKEAPLFRTTTYEKLICRAFARCQPFWDGIPRRNLKRRPKEELAQEQRRNGRRHVK